MSNSKITAEHKGRIAYVYVRQSTMQQVRLRRQSKRRQYELAEKAKRLGFHRVEIIDDDLGKSGTGSEERPGFGRLLARVCEGQAGAVFAMEASRLARNNRDWQHLVDLCALTDTLVVDDDGIYDPTNRSDRLLLGVKGSMAEFEIGIIRQRAREALEEMIAKGAWVTEAPIGYERVADNRIEMTPDKQVQDAIRGALAKFRELGTARQVLLWYCQNQLRLPYWKRTPNGRVVAWRIPIYNQILRLLKNPAYAGAFVYGQTETRKTVADGRALKSRGHNVPVEEWRLVIRDHHEAYIQWDEFLRNRQQVRSNGTMSPDGSKAPRKGVALLSGILRCRRCGRMLHTSYSSGKYVLIRYTCKGNDRQHGGFKCISFSGGKLDAAVSQQVLDVVKPAGIEAAFMAWDQMAHQSDEKRKSLELAVQKATYEADRAHHQYDQVDPENRLVASELERRWERALNEVERVQERLDALDVDASPCDEKVREKLLELGDDLQTVWDHPEASPMLKKRIVRTLIKEIVVDIANDPPQVQACIHWEGGVHTELRVRKNKTGRHKRCTDMEVVDVVRELAKVCRDRDIAAILNRLGYRTGTGKTWVQSSVCALRNYRKIPPMPRKDGRTWVTLTEASKQLRISQASVRKLINDKILPATQVVPHAPWVIESANLATDAVQDAANAMRSRRYVSWSTDQPELPFEREC
jgi:DNA invertase Pin-like site-specific DNA recombinase